MNVILEIHFVDHIVKVKCARNDAAIHEAVAKACIKAGESARFYNFI